MSQSQSSLSAGIGVRYTVECLEHLHPDGGKCRQHGRCGVSSHTPRVRWRDGFTNLVVTAGRNALLDNTFNAAAGSVSWFVGLKSEGTVAAADTMDSHSGWTEIVDYDEETRPAWTKNGQASNGAMSNSNAKASFSITDTATVAGAFLTSSNTKEGTSGTLFGAGDFNTPREVEDGDTLNVQVDLSIAAS